MSIGDLCNRDVAFALRETTIGAAAKLMRHYHVGSLVVIDEKAGRRLPVGIITDRDVVVEVVATELDAGTITVGDIMTPEVVTAPESMGVMESIQLMRVKGVRRLPIVDGSGGLAGIVTVDDLLDMLAEELGELARIVVREQVREAQLRK
jgi:CBS-domain-containing membrane protein